MPYGEWNLYYVLKFSISKSLEELNHTYNELPFEKNSFMRGGVLMDVLPHSLSR